jgi:hypothetical protein
MNTNQKKSKRGGEKLRLKKNAKLKALANDPKQKMCIGYFSNVSRAIFYILGNFPKFAHWAGAYPLSPCIWIANK